MNQQVTTEKLERRLANVEKLLRELLDQKKSEWITEKEAMEMLGRSSRWLKAQRLGENGIEPVLIEGHDWKRMNNKTPFYKRSSIEKRKHLNPQP